MSFQVHEDTRRTLYDWAQGNFKSAKAVVVKEQLYVGDHYHNNKDEEFFLLQGEFITLQVGDIILTGIKAPYHINIPRKTYHKFLLATGSILLGTSTELFDQTDEIK